MSHCKEPQERIALKIIFSIKQKETVRNHFQGVSEEDMASLEEGQGASDESETLGQQADMKRWAETMKACKKTRMPLQR